MTEPAFEEATPAFNDAAAPVPVAQLRSGSAGARFRSLSPHGRAIKAVPHWPQRYRAPDLQHVTSRYRSQPVSHGADAPEAPCAAERARSMSARQRISHTKHFWWRLGRLHSDVPDFKLSQPGLYDRGHPMDNHAEWDIAQLPQTSWSFDAAHPCVAAYHHKRTHDDRAAQREVADARRSVSASHKRCAQRRAGDRSWRRAQSASATRRAQEADRARSAGAAAARRREDRWQRLRAEPLQLAQWRARQPDIGRDPNIAHARSGTHSTTSGGRDHARFDTAAEAAVLGDNADEAGAALEGPTCGNVERALVRSAVLPIA